ncbi:MAG: heme-binding protein [Pseudomonadota bacterium]
MRTELTLTDVDAELAIAVIRDQLRRDGKAAVIAVADAQGEPIALLRLDGALRAPIQIAMNKAFTAARERRPTFDIGRDARHPERGFDMGYYGDSRYLGWGGGVPVVFDGQVVGAVAVSGIPEEEDMRLAAMGVAAIVAAQKRP